MKRHFAVFLALLLAGALATPSALAWQSSTKKKKKTTTRITSPVIPPGTKIQMRIIEDLDSGTTQAGSEFHGTLTRAIVSGGRTLYSKGADVTGRVTVAKKSGRLTDPGILELELTSVKSGTKQSRIATEFFKLEGKSHTKSTVAKIGGGAAAGAIIGAIAGGGKGAAIGAGVGAAAGTGVAAATGKKEAKVESEAVITFVTIALPPAAAASSGVTSYDEGSPDAYLFTARDRRVIRTCFREHASELPPGLAQRESLTPGHQRQLEKNGTLPPGLQNRVQPLPSVCENQLPRLPRELERVIFSRQVMIINSAYRILDLFDLDEE